MLLDIYEESLYLFYMANKQNYIRLTVNHLIDMKTRAEHDVCIIGHNRFFNKCGILRHSVKLDCAHKMNINRDLALAIGKRHVSKDTITRLSNTITPLSTIGKAVVGELNVYGHGSSYTIPSNKTSVQEICLLIEEMQLTVVVEGRSKQQQLAKWGYCKTKIQSVERQHTTMTN